MGFYKSILFINFKSMKNIGVLFSFGLILMLFITGCSPVRKLESEVLKPAEIGLPAHIKRVGLLFIKPSNNFEYIKGSSFQEKVLQELKYGIADVTKNTPRFSPENILLLDKTDIPSLRDTDSITWGHVEVITDSLDLDALIIMNRFTLKDSLDAERSYVGAQTEYYFVLEISAKVNWLICVPQGKQILDNYTYKEPYVWEALAYDKGEAIRQLPDYEEAFLEAAYWTGYDYADRILPVWEENDRTFYVRGNKYMRQAAQKAENGNWKEAIRIWKRNLNHYDKELVSRSAFNIAVAMEMLGEIELAMKWARRADEIKPKERAREYYETLKERKEESEKLEQQLP